MQNRTVPRGMLLQTQSIMVHTREELKEEQIQHKTKTFSFGID